MTNRPKFKEGTKPYLFVKLANPNENRGKQMGIKGRIRWRIC